MFKSLELLIEMQSLRDLGLDEEEIQGYLEMFFDTLFDKVEIA